LALEHGLRKGTRKLFTVIVLAFASSAYAFTETVTSSGTPVRWKTQDGGFKFNLAGNPINASGLDSEDFRQAVVTGLQRWQAASGPPLNFDYWQGTDDSIYLPNSDYNGLSSIYFASHGGKGQGLTPNILGLTQVWYNTTNGEILEADTVLNDRDFHFTMNPQDTSGYGSKKSTFQGSDRVYIENVITHELGHSLGFSHAGGLQSTMLFMESPEEAHLGCDEQIGIHAMYPSGDQGARGSITGHVNAPSGAPLFGAHVVAISRQRGTVLSSAMTNAGGDFAIAALEVGTYYLMVEPYYAGPTPLPAYYQNINPIVCPGNSVFGRTFLTFSNQSIPYPLQVPSGGNVSAPVITVGCSSGGAAVRSATSGENIYNPAQDSSGFGVVDQFHEPLAHSYRLTGLSGDVEFRAISYSLYSPAAFTMALLDSNGNDMGLSSDDNSYVGDSGYVDYDGSMKAASLPLGDYTLEVTPRALSVTLYPAGSLSLDKDAFLLVTGSVNQSHPALASVLPVNARCRMPEVFAAYQSPPGNPPRASTDQSDSGGGGCATMRNINSDDDQSSGGGPGPGAIIGWLLPWIAMGAMARFAKALARQPRQS
jgi:hypothetical protein